MRGFVCIHFFMVETELVVREGRIVSLRRLHKEGALLLALHPFAHE
jgi:hypothetical protein